MNEFARWFRSQASELRRVHGESAADRIERRLARVHRGLHAEVAQTEADSELVITARGDAQLFALVEEVTTAIAGIDGWIVYALKPALGFDFVLELDGRKISALELRFEPLQAAGLPGMLGVRVLVPNVGGDQEELADVVRLILATGLGERDATAIDHVEVGNKPAETSALPIGDLAQFLAWHRTQNRSS